jgi:hypothetical protein
MRAYNAPKAKTFWQVRWIGRLGTRTFRTRKEAREVAKNSWHSEWQKPLIVKVTEQVIR